MKIIVLGSGLVGGPMALDLAKDNEFEVTVADLNSSRLDEISFGNNIRTVIEDLSNPQTVKTLIGDFDMVLNAVPGFMGFNTLKAIIESGKNVVDIAFFPEDMFALDSLARKNNVIAISDIGVARV
ncbi:MAG: saccharopine dehydrogenase NADP-binding domain-containing protein [Bacteroidales bacterium]